MDLRATDYHANFRQCALLLRSLQRVQLPVQARKVQNVGEHAALHRLNSLRHPQHGLLTLGAYQRLLQSKLVSNVVRSCIL